MPQLEVTVQCPIHDSFRMQQVAGMFDVPLADKATEVFNVEVPELDGPWQIGLITSGNSA